LQQHKTQGNANSYIAQVYVSEAAALKIQHIDSKNMRLVVDYGKGGKDRYTLLSETFRVLHEYFRIYRRNILKAGFFREHTSHITS